MLLATVTLLGSLAVGIGRSGAEPNAGDLDVSFNTTGVAETAIVNNIAADDIARTARGELLVLANSDVWRFDADGDLDTGFGGNGKGVVDVATDPQIFPTRLASMPDGRFVVAGFVAAAGGPTLGAARLLADGRIDPSFGTDVDDDGGADQIPFLPPGSFDTSSGNVGLVLQSTGHVVLIGVAETGAGFNETPAVGRISPDGVAGDVRVITPPAGSSTTFRPLDAAVTAGDGMVIAVGGQVPDAVAAVRLESDLDLDPGFGGDLEGTEGDQLMLTRVTTEPELDREFGDGGVAAFTGGGDDAGESVAVAPDAAVIVGGSFEGCESRLGFVLRRDEDGRLDTGFGGNRSSCAGFAKPGVVHFNHPVHGVTVDSGGRVLAVGEDFDGGTGAFGVVARLTPDGAADPTFGNGFPVRIDAPDDGIELRAVAVDDEDRIVAVGTGDDFQASLGRLFEMIVVRLLPDGSPDPSFNDGEPVQIPLDLGQAEGRAVAVAPDGKIVVAGSRFEIADNVCCGQLVVARLNEDGSPDEGFGSGDDDSPGVLFETIGDAVNRASGVAVRPDGRIVVGGLAADEPASPFATVLQVLADGSRDPSFADDGLFTTRDTFPASVGGLALDDTGNVVVAGGTTSGDVLVARLTAAGEPDAAFGAAGLVLTDLGGGEAAAGVALDGQGRIVIGGGVDDERGSRVLAARYHPVTVVAPEPEEPEPDPEEPADPPPPPVVTPTVTFNPRVGRAGETTVATGTGFPPGATVTFDWSQGIDSIPPTTAGPDGTFILSVLVLPSETFGNRTLTAATTDPATGLPLTAAAPYLVAAGTTQPGDFVGRR
ncbi:MAG: hypothetical protein ACRD0A_08170 [Acidimicrobiales bacterium]